MIVLAFTAFLTFFFLTWTLFSNAFRRPSEIIWDFVRAEYEVIGFLAAKLTTEVTG